MSAKQEPSGAVNIDAPIDEHAMERLEIMLSIAKTCERLAEAMNCPVQTVTIHGNITSNAPYELRVGKRKPRSA